MVASTGAQVMQAPRPYTRPTHCHTYVRGAAHAPLQRDVPASRMPPARAAERQRALVPQAAPVREHGANRGEAPAAPRRLAPAQGRRLSPRRAATSLTCAP